MDVTVLIIALIIGLVLYAVSGKIYRFYIFSQRVNKVPGPNFTIPYFGTMYYLMTLPKEDRLDWFKSISDQYKDGIFRTWLAFGVNVHLRNPTYVEAILRSNTQITKSTIYDFLKPWLGYGLLTSTGAQWHHSRKLITPAFHFKILEEFAEVMVDKAAILNKCLEREMKINGDKPIDIFVLAVKCTLDIICETAMGINVHAQEDIDNNYSAAVHTISTVATDRFFLPWLRPDWLFYKLDPGKRFQAAVDITHDLGTKLIKKKQRDRKLGKTLVNETDGDELAAGERKKYAFMDRLLEANENVENPLTIEEIRDQVNTFMFAGHDTTAALVSWTLFCLGNALDIQQKVFEELQDVLGDSDDQDLVKLLPNLKYLERVLKETLRLYPSAPVVSRRLLDDFQIGDYLVPKDATVTIQIRLLQTDPSLWPDPQRFDPDRFLPENSIGRHPYAYVPFSAGPRNCIGQKFAMLEAKVILVQVLRKFSVKSVHNHATIKKYSDLILKPVDGILLHVKKR